MKSARVPDRTRAFFLRGQPYPFTGSTRILSASPSISDTPRFALNDPDYAVVLRGVTVPAKWSAIDTYGSVCYSTLR